MRPEQKLTNGKAASIFRNLQRAVKEGAIGAQYANGECLIYPPNVPDKDSLEPMVESYGELLSSRGVPPKDVFRSTQDIRKKFYGGTASDQSETFETLNALIRSVDHE